ncbi:hypothetical protein [uncultured Eubacterium sp.]|uniref:hypothetical protein n=1 Tax=uncultured Eubacterium sp. TaxID=165185 RepID=UPI0026740DF3|nr:hypothetical protein [uncultured Eubacterium sp.]
MQGFNFSMGGNVLLKDRISVKRVLISFLIVAAIEFAAFYVLLPPFNIHSIEFWQFQGFFILVFLVLTISLPDKERFAVKYNIITKIAGIILILGVFVVIIGNIISAKIFNAHKYSSLIDINNTKFENIIQPSDKISDIALMDTSSARVVGQRAIGALSDVVSQYEINDDYSQIALDGAPMKVATLEYAGFFKWFNNRKEGIPGYVLVDAVKFEADYVKLEKAIKYTESGWFNDNLERHLRFKYPTAIFEGYYFELDEDGNPYYICPTMTARVGLFGGYDVNGVIICDPCTGDCKKYSLDEIPRWVDRVYDGDLIQTKYNWHGMLADGFWNSIIGQKDCKKTTDDYGYKVIDNDVWIYTGVTSVIDDSSNIGFVMVNARTGEACYFNVAGAEEFSAMEAAEGQVQNLGYDAAFPSLINIDGRPTYFMVLKDKGNLVKQYALVDVKKYSIVATGTTQAETLITYRKLLKENGINTTKKAEDLSKLYDFAEIIVKSVQYVNLTDGTYVYISDESGNVYKEKFSEDEALVFIQEGNKINIYYDTNEDTGIRNIQAWEKKENGENER